MGACETTTQQNHPTQLPLKGRAESRIALLLPLQGQRRDGNGVRAVAYAYKSVASDRASFGEWFCNRFSPCAQKRRKAESGRGSACARNDHAACRASSAAANARA